MGILFSILLWFGSFFQESSAQVVICYANGYPDKYFQQNIETWHGLFFYDSRTNEEWFLVQDKRYNPKSVYLCDITYRRGLNPVIIEMLKSDRI